MTNRTAQQVADELNSLRARSVNIVQGVIAGSANPGGRISFTYTNPIDGRSYTAEGLAWNMCTPSQVSAMKLADGSWVVVGSHEPATMRSVIHMDRRSRPQPKTLGNIKVLYAEYEDGELIFYVGGDRETPRRIGSIPSSCDVEQAVLNNLGGDRWTVALRYYYGRGTTHFRLISSNSSEIDLLATSTEIAPINDYYLPYDEKLLYRGNGFWSQNPSLMKEFYSDNPSWVYFDVNESRTTQGGSRNNYVDTISVTALSNRPDIAAGGSGGYVSTGDQGGEPGDYSDYRTYNGSGSYYSEVPLYSLLQESVTRTDGRWTDMYSEQGASLRTVQGFVDTDTGAGGGTEEIYWRWNSTVFPGGVKPSHFKATLTQSNSFTTIYEGGTLRVSTATSLYQLVSEWSYHLSILLGKGAETALYKRIEGTRTTTIASVGSYPVFSTANETHFFLHTSEKEIELGGTLPEFSPKDTLIGNRYFKVNRSDQSRWDVDVYQLGAQTRKSSVKVKVYYKQKQGRYFFGASYHP